MPVFQSVTAGGAPPHDDRAQELTAFKFNTQPVRTLTKDGRAWFVVADVCAVLEHSNPTKAIARLDDDEKGQTTVWTLGGNQTLSVISESAFIIWSSLPKAPGRGLCDVKAAEIIASVPEAR